jgi:CheY-like chemotaxis protein
MLTELGYEVVEGDSARAGLEHFTAARSPFDLILADHAMPGMTGGELIAQMRANDPGLRSLLISGYAGNIPDGYGPVLRKPFTLGDLSAAVARILQLG